MHGTTGDAADVVSETAAPTIVPVPDVVANKHWNRHCQLCRESFTSRGMRKHMEQVHASAWLVSKPVVDSLCALSGLQDSRNRVNFVAMHTTRLHNMFMCATFFSRLLLNIRCKRQGLTLTMAGQALEPEAEFMEFFGATMPALRDTVAKRAADLSSQTGPNKRPHLEAPKQGKGKGWGKGSRNNGGWGNRIQHSTPTQAAFTLSSDDLQHMMHIMARLLVQQDNEIQMIKMDKQFLLHFETRPQGMVHMFWESAQVWKQAKAEQPPKVDKSLMVTLLLCMMMELEARLDKMLVHEQTKNNLIMDGWLQTVVALHGLDGGKARAGQQQSGDPTRRRDGDHSRDQEEPLGQDRRVGAQVPQRSPLGGADGGRHSPVSAFHQHAWGAGGSDLRALPHARRQHGATDRGGSASRRTSSEAATGQSAGGRNPATAEQVKQAQRQVLNIRLQNQRNVCYCYINSLALLWAWASTFHTDFSQVAGAATSALRALLTGKGLLDLLGPLPWRRFFQGWHNIRLQHDLHEWHTHVFDQVQSQFLRGSWHAKLLSLELRDSSEMFAPILMTPPSHLQECSLQRVVDQWSAQEAMHALNEPPQFMCVCLTRFGYSDGVAFKLTMPMSLQTTTITFRSLNT